MSQLSNSLAASMEASFVNMETLIDGRISHHVSQDVPNRSFTAPSPVLVRQSPSQGRQDHSLGSPRTGYRNPVGHSEELVQDESAIPSFLNSLRDAGIELPQGIKRMLLVVWGLVLSLVLHRLRVLWIHPGWTTL